MYRSSNKQYFDEMKDDSLLTENPAETYLIYKKFSYLDDLLTYINSIYPDSKNEVGVGDLTSKVAVVYEDFSDINTIAYVKMIFSKMNLPYHSLYATAFKKNKEMDQNTASQLLLKEMSILKPSIVLYFTSDVSFVEDFKSNIEVHHINTSVVSELVSLSNIENKTPEQNERMTHIKKDMWSKIKNIMKYI